MNKGLDLSLYSSRLDVQHIRAEFENLYSKLCNLLSTSQCLISKQKLIRLYSRFVTNYFHKKRRKLSKSILNEEQNCALKSSRKDRDIVITKPDKGNGVVILNRNDYVDKMHKILDDCTKFMPCNQDTNLSNLTKFQRSLYYLNSKKALCSKIYSRISPTSTTTPSLYGLPKLHEPGIPLRPILSFIGSFDHECAQWFSQISDNIPDTFTFLSKISKHNFANQTMVSFDVKSLFTNIPLSFTLNLLLESIYVDNSTEWNGLNRSRLLKLLSWSTKNMSF